MRFRRNIVLSTTPGYIARARRDELRIEQPWEDVRDKRPAGGAEEREPGKARRASKLAQKQTLYAVYKTVSDTIQGSQQ